MVETRRDTIDPEISNAQERMFSLQRRLHRGEISTALLLETQEATSAYIVASTRDAKTRQRGSAFLFRVFQRFFSK